MLARAGLRRQGIRPGTVRRPSLLRQLRSSPRIRPADITLFSRQLATLLTAGVPLIQSLEIMGRGHERPAMQRLTGDIRAQIERGNPLSDSLARYPEQFDPLYCNLVRAGEQAGLLDDLLQKIAVHQEKTERLKKRVGAALTYPLLVVLVAGVVSGVLLVFVVPQFESLFHGFGATLPPLTLAVIGLSQQLKTLGPWLLVLVPMAVLGLIRLKRDSEPFNYWLDQVSLALPVLGQVLRKAAVARFTRTLSVLTRAGVPLVEALPSATGACGNRVYAANLEGLRSQVAAGSSLQRALRQTGAFPERVIQMVAIGEESGMLDDMLGKVADFYEEEVETRVEGLSRLIEPLIMAVLGVLVGGLVLAMYLPLFKLGGIA
jgi:type IV pilus assembly protein PilC